jgi:hypothetical protein
VEQDRKGTMGLQHTRARSQRREAARQTAESPGLLVPRPYWYSVLRADNGAVLLVLEAIDFTVDDGVCVEPLKTIPDPRFE